MRNVHAWITALMLATPGVASAQWLSLQSDHFHVVGNASERDLRTVALKMEQFRDVIRQLNPGFLGDDSAPPVRVVVFRNKGAYEPFMPRSDGRIVPVAGFFQPGQDVNYITLTPQSGDQAYRPIFHEYAHLLLGGVLAHAPLWFNEGLAEYYSTFEVMGRRRAAIGMPIQHHFDLLRARRLPFARFFALDHQSPEYNRDTLDRSVLYAQSWVIVHHAFHSEAKRAAQLLAFVTMLSEGGAPGESFEAAYDISLADLELELQLYVEKVAHLYRGYDFSDSIPDRIDTPVTRISAAESEAWQGDLLAHMDRRDEATVLLEKSLAAEPDLAVAHAALGMLQIRSDKAPEGMAHLREALRLGVTNAAAYFAYAATLVTEDPRDIDGLAGATTALERAVALRPSYTEAKLLLGYTYLATDRATAARDLLTPLVRAEPANHRAALRLGETLLRLDDPDGARAVVGPVLARATNESERDQAKRLLGVVAEMQARAAARAEDRDPPASGGQSASVARNSPSPTTLFLRPLASGEQRTFGTFEVVECGSNGVTLVVRTPTGVLRARAASFDEIDFVAFRKLATATVACGPQPPFEVYLTWKAAGSVVGADGTAVALEVLPEGYVPPPSP